MFIEDDLMSYHIHLSVRYNPPHASYLDFKHNHQILERNDHLPAMTPSYLEWK